MNPKENYSFKGYSIKIPAGYYQSRLDALQEQLQELVLEEMTVRKSFPHAARELQRIMSL